MNAPNLLDGFSIGGYRSFTNVQRVGPLSKINVFIGPNNSGKSNILQFLFRHWQTLAGMQPESKTKFKLDRQIDEPRATTNKPLIAGIGSRSDSTRIDEFRTKMQSKSSREFVDKLLGQPELSRGTELLWHERVKATPDSQIEIASIDENTARTLLQRLDPEHYAFEHAFGATDPGWTGGSREARMKRIVEFLLAPPNLSASWILIPAIRQVAPKKENSQSWCGAGIIDHLAELQSPEHYEQEKRNLFSAIITLLKEVTGNESAELAIPHNRKNIIVHMDGKSLPLESLGTGIHELIIMAATCTTLERHMICIEEPELHLNPLLQRKFLRYLYDKTNNQYFLTSHSAALLDTDVASVFRVSHNKVETTVELASAAGHKWQICRDLGYKASDLMQSNAVVWVEGPSDRIYLNHWIHSVSPDLIENTHYSIMFYGGRLLCHLSADDTEVGDFISLCHLNRNPAIMIDSDKRSAKQEINSTKQRVFEEFATINAFSWVTAGREIENYIDKEMLAGALANLGNSTFEARSYRRYQKVIPEGVDKIKLAKEITRQDANLNVLDLKEQIDKLVLYIRAANK